MEVLETASRALPRLAGILALLFIAGPVSPAWADEAAEDQIKAAFLYKFGSYVEWPPAAFPAADAPFTVGVVGADDMARNLETVVANRTMAGRPVAVRMMQAGESLSGVQMLFIGASAGGSLAAELERVGEVPILIVTEAGDSLPPGSMINFVVADNKVRFDVDLVSAERNSLKISSRLLAVARKVASP